jgi:hypothetical protein
MSTTIAESYKTIELKRRWKPREELRVSGRAKKTSKTGKRAPAHRIGVVPDTPAALSHPADLVFPPNSGLGQPNVTNHGGAIAPGVPVQIIYWGSVWVNGANSSFSTQFTNAAQLLFNGPYYSALRPTRTSWTCLSSAMTGSSIHRGGAQDGTGLV